MAGYSLEVIEKYRTALKKNPNSQVFAPLADAYREMGQLDLAEKICNQGISIHPDFPGGWVVLGKILKDKNLPEKAIMALERTIQLSGDNILAHTLLGEIYLEKREAGKAIKSFKMVLFFNPQHAKVKKILEKIEALTAKDFSEEVFQFKKLTLPEDSNSYLPETTALSLDPKSPERRAEHSHRSLLRILSLVDAFIARNDLKKSLELLTQADKEYPNEKEIAHRIKILKSKNQFSFISSENLASPEMIKTLNSSKQNQIRQKKLEILTQLLQSIESEKSI